MNNCLFFKLLLCMFTLPSIFAQEVPCLYSLALDKASQEFHTQLIKQQSFKNRLALIKKWDKKSGGLTIPKDCTFQESVLERFEQKYFTKLKEYQTFTGNIKAITHDNTKVIICNNNDTSTLEICDIRTGNTIHTLNGHTDEVTSVNLNSDNNKAISASDDHTLILWDLATGKSIHVLQGHTDNTSNLTFTSDDNNAISASRDGTLILWDLKVGKPIHTLKPIHSLGDCVLPVTRVSLTSNNDKIISGSADGTLTLWDLNTGKSIHNLKSHTSVISKIIPTSDNNKAISACTNNTLILWDLNTGKPIRSHTLRDKDNFFNSNIALISNSKAISTSGNELTLWDLNTNKPIHTLKCTESIANAIPTLDNTKVISFSADNVLTVWDLRTGCPLQQIKINSPLISPSLRISNNLIASGNKLYQIEDWQSIIMNMPLLSKKTISAPHSLLDVKQVGALTGLYKARLLKQKIQASPIRFSY